MDLHTAKMTEDSLSGEGIIVFSPLAPEAHAQRRQQNEQNPAQDVHQCHFKNEEVHLWYVYILARCYSSKHEKESTDKG